MLEKNHLTLEIINLKIEMVKTNEKMMTFNTMTDLEMKGIIMDKIRTGITDIQMRITVLDNPTMNEEDTLETEAHQTTITETEEVQIT